MLKNGHASLFMWLILAKNAALIADIHLNLAALLCKGKRLNAFNRFNAFNTLINIIY